MKDSRENRLIDKIAPTAIARSRKDINQWRSALRQAENVENPKRVLLYNLYDELVLDAHLTAEIKKRILALQGSDYYLFDSNGEHNEEIATLFKSPWFNQFMSLAAESIFWGHSLIEVKDFNEDGTVKNIELYNRKHVRPETGIVVVNQNDDAGTFFRDPIYERYILEIGDKQDLGLLNKCAPHILYKRFAQSAWSEFTEIFGMPIRYIKTNTKDTESLSKAEAMLINMGASAYAVIDKEEELEFIESSKTDGNVYEKLINLCNAEISKLLMGSVIGEASNGGSRSKEEVGLKIQEQTTLGDKQFVEGIINTQLLPKLKEFGYAVDGFTFEFERSKDLNKLWDITQGVLNHYDVDEQFIIDTFNIPVTGKKANSLPTTVKPTANSDSSFFE